MQFLIDNQMFMCNQVVFPISFFEKFLEKILRDK